MDLDAYLERIGYEGEPRIDLDTLRAIHRAHLLAIPYETLDVSLGRGASRDPDVIFDKLVTRRRGGWCYEMCGLLGMALDEIGFDVTPLAGGVERVVRGDSAVGNHLVLLVTLDEPYLCDVGFGDGLLEPIELRAGRRPAGVPRVHGWSSWTKAGGGSTTTPRAPPRRSTSSSTAPTRRSSTSAATGCRRAPTRRSSRTWSASDTFRKASSCCAARS